MPAEHTVNFSATTQICDYMNKTKFNE